MPRNYLAMHLSPDDKGETRTSLYTDERGGWLTFNEHLTIHFGDRLDAMLSLATGCLELARAVRIKQAALKASENGDNVDEEPVPESSEQAS